MIDPDPCAKDTARRLLLGALLVASGTEVPREQTAFEVVICFRGSYLQRKVCDTYRRDCPQVRNLKQRGRCAGLYSNETCNVRSEVVLARHCLQSSGPIPSLMAASSAAMQSATSLVPMWPGSDWMLSSPYPVEPLNLNFNFNLTMSLKPHILPPNSKIVITSG